MKIQRYIISRGGFNDFREEIRFIQISFRYIETDRLLDAEGNQRDSRFKSRDRRHNGRINTMKDIGIDET